MKVLFDKFDTHTHSNISDGANSPVEMIEAAAAQGLKVFTLTDHFDIHDRFPAKLSPFDGAGQEAVYTRLSKLKQREFGTKFLKGIEIGQAHQFREVAADWLASHEYDFVLAACHIIRGHIDFYHMDYEKNHPDSLLKQYFAELIELCEWGGGEKFDSLAHLAYPLRYMRGLGSLDNHKAAIDKLFKVMVKHEIALEINTGHAVVCPELEQVARFSELGGRLITIGSDSHSVNTIAQRIHEGVRVAKAAGFTECVYYENRKPCFIQI